MTALWPRLRTIVEGRIAAAGGASIAVLSLDHDPHGVFGRDAGLGAVLDRLRDALATGEPAPAILLIGVWAEDDFRARVAAVPGAAVLAWPGLRYLRYVFGDEELHSAAARARAGSDALVPLPTRRELAAGAASAQHWLESTARGHAGGAVIFADAAQGAITLSRRMLEPAVWLSPEHSAGLARLDACLRLTPELSDGPALADLLGVEIDDLRAASDGLEALKTSLRSEPPTTETPDLRAADLHDLAEAAAALDAASVRLLEHVRMIAARLGGLP